MSGLDNNIQQNINSLIIGKFSNGITKLSVKKIKEFIKKTYNIDMDDNAIEELLSNNSVVQGINGDEISLGETNKEEQEAEVLDDVEDTAQDQAENNLNDFFESIADALYKIHKDMEYESNKIQLDENDLYYHLHKGAVKNKSIYVVNKINPSSVLNESTVECFIKGSNISIELPIKNFVK